MQQLLRENPEQLLKMENARKVQLSKQSLKETIDKKPELPDKKEEKVEKKGGKMENKEKATAKALSKHSDVNGLNSNAKHKTLALKRKLST